MRERRGASSGHENVEAALVASWHTNARVTEFLVQHLPLPVWRATVPGAPRRTVRAIAGHIHNARCMWIKWLGAEYDIRVPASVDRHRITPSGLTQALSRSARRVAEVIEAGLHNEQGLRAPIAYRNLPDDVPHFVAYLIAHEGHHRGQICLVARQIGHRLPADVTTGLWQWIRRADEEGWPGR